MPSFRLVVWVISISAAVTLGIMHYKEMKGAG